MFKKLRAKRSQKILERMKSKGESKELFRIPYVSSKLGTRQYRYFGELVFSDKAIAFLLIEKFRLLTYDYPPILIMYLLSIFILGDILEALDLWGGLIIGGALGAVLAGFVHDQLRKRRQRKIKLQITKFIEENRQPQMEDILTFFWRERVHDLNRDGDTLIIDWGGQRAIEVNLHDKLDFESLDQKISEYLDAGQEGGS